MKKLIFKLQGGYYLITGIWPVLHMPSFLNITGPKTDLWLVEMVGLLSASIGAALFFRAGHYPYLLAVCPALSYLIIDCIYAFSEVIPVVYLCDAAIQFMLLLGFLATWKRRA